MRTTRTLLALGTALAGLLAGCSPRETMGPWSPAEDRINAAFPLSEPLRANRAWLEESANGADRREVTARVAARLKLRALNCAQGYTPSWLAGADDIRKQLAGTQCFADTDAELARWTGLLRAGIVLARPPLKPLPATSPSAVVADGFISAASFAAAAPIALLAVGPGQSIQLVDMETSRTLLREPAAASTNIGPLSPNGRLFVVGDSDRTRIRDSETGAVLAELPQARWFSFHWLDARTAVYARAAGGPEKAMLIDFASGREVAIPWLTGGMQRAAAVPGSDDHYLIVGGGAITKVALQRRGLEPTVSLVGDKRQTGVSWANNTSGATADGSRFFASAMKSLKIVDVATLEVDSVEFEPFTLQQAFATPDPDRIVLTGYAQGISESRSLLYSVSRRTLAQIDAARVNSTRYVYVPAMRKQGVLNDRKIDLLDTLPAQEEVALAKFTADLQEQVNQRKLATFDQQQAWTGIAPGGTAGVPQFAGAPLAALAREAQVEAIGVYQGAGSTAAAPGARRMGHVEVRIRRSARPVVLVLSSYEPVRWMLVSEGGARVAAVLVSGYYPSQVVGAGNARVIMTGTAHAYKQDSAEFQALNRDVARTVGKGINLFQGRYEGSQFSVGGL